MLKLPYQVSQVENDAVPLVIAPGYLSIQADRDAQGRWKDGSLVRFANSSGLPQKVGGWVDQTPTALGSGFKGALRQFHEWQSLDRQFWMAIATNCKLYLYNQGIAYDITPLRRQAFLSSPFTTVNTSNIVTVTDPGHGAFVGDNVQFSGATTFNNVTINGEYTVLSITLNTYTIQAATTANAGGSGGGASITATYDINALTIDASPALGWSANTWGTPRAGNLGWGSPAASSNIVSPVGMWSLDNWGQDLIASPRGGSIYTWAKTTGPFARATLITQAPVYNNRVLVSQEARQIIAFGSSSSDVNLNPTGPLDPALIRFCNTEDYTTWVPSVTNTAGSVRLNSGSGIVGVTKTRGGYYVGSTKSAALFYATGDTNVYASNSIGQASRPCGPNALADFNGTTYIMAQDNFQEFDGVLQTMNCDVWNSVYDPQLSTSLNRNKMEKVTCHINRQFTEVWWNYPSIGGTGENDRYVCYNWVLKCWHYGSWSGNAGGDINRSAGHDWGDVFNAPYMGWFNTTSVATPNLNGFSRLFQHETGALANNQLQFGEYVESWDFDILNSGELVAISHVYPNFKEFISVGGDTPQIQIQIKTRKYPDEAYKIKGPYAYQPGNRKIDCRAKARQMALLIGGDNGSGPGNLRLLETGGIRLIEGTSQTPGFRLLEPGSSTSQGVVWTMGMWRIKMGEDGDR